MTIADQQRALSFLRTAEDMRECRRGGIRLVRVEIEAPMFALTPEERAILARALGYR